MLCRLVVTNESKEALGSTQCAGRRRCWRPSGRLRWLQLGLELVLVVRLGRWIVAIEAIAKPAWILAR